jgi:hypothetical protein
MGARGILTNVEAGGHSVQRVFLKLDGSNAVLKTFGAFLFAFCNVQKLLPYNVIMENCNRFGVFFCGFSKFCSPSLFFTIHSNFSNFVGFRSNTYMYSRMHQVLAVHDATPNLNTRYSTTSEDI